MNHPLSESLVNHSDSVVKYLCTKSDTHTP